MDLHSFLQTRVYFEDAAKYELHVYF